MRQKKLTKKQLRAMFAKQKYGIELSGHSDDELLNALLVRAKIGDESSNEYKAIEKEVRGRRLKGRNFSV